MKSSPLTRCLGWLSAMLGFCASLSLHAQWMTLPDTSAAPVVVESVSINAEITGRFAVTTFDLTFRNPNPRNLEGLLEFPLLDGQRIIRFALDINGNLREAVPVEKERGRVVFESIARRRVDPGLLEQTSGNNYRARVFPLPAGGTRRIVIAYQEDLSRIAGGSFYRLALAFPDKLKSFRMSVSIPGKDIGSTKSKTSLPLELPAWRENNSFEITRSDFLAKGLVELELPPHTSPTIATGFHGDDEYFYAELPVPADASRQQRPAPRVVGLLWDSSASGARRDHEKELALLDAFFRDIGNAEVRLIRLRDTAQADGCFTIKKGNWSKLRDALEDTVYDAATSITDLTDDPAVDQWILFSDGLINYGTATAPDRLQLSAPVHTVCASVSAAPIWLRGIARVHGGEFVNLISTRPTDAAKQLRHPSLRIIAVNHDAGAFDEVFPAPGTPITGESIIVTGRLLRESASLKLQIGHDATDTATVDLMVHTRQNPSALPPRAWASTKIDQLSFDRTTNKETIRRTAESFGIVTSDTSLIVLETLDDYLRYDIMPPTELRDAWLRHRAVAKTNKERETARHLEVVASSFTEKHAWWSDSFPKGTPPKITTPRGKPSGGSQPVFGGNATREFSDASRQANDAANEARANRPDEEVIVLSPFMIEVEDEVGYLATQTLAGSRVNTRLRDVASRASVDDSETSPTPPPSGSIVLRPWSSNASYIRRLSDAEPEERLEIYLEEREDHALEPGFFLEVADFFFAEKDQTAALRILSNLAELGIEDTPMLRVLAYRLMQADRPDLARPIFERILTLRGEEPQSFRDLALACSLTGQSQRAVDLLWSVVSRPWDNRFPGIELTALEELNAIAANSPTPLDLSKVDPRLRENMPEGLRVVLSWDADNSDIDLWVTDPNGEIAMYNHPLTYQGGRMSRDFTGGYGPETFILRTPKPGKYEIRVNYYGDSRTTALGPVTVCATVYTDFGTPKQREQKLTLRLTEHRENALVGTVKFGDR